MMFLIEGQEVKTHCAEEAIALHRLRADMISYLREQIHSKLILAAYFYRNMCGHILIIECSDLESLDSLIKASPIFPHCSYNVTPVQMSDAVVREISKAINVDFSSSGIFQAEVKPQRMQAKRGKFWIVRKEVLPLNPLISDAEQNAMLQRTIYSKTFCNSSIEILDLNAVGKMAAYLLAMGEAEDVMDYVKQCPSIQDIQFTIEQIYSLDQAFSQISPPMAFALEMDVD